MEPIASKALTRKLNMCSPLFGQAQAGTMESGLAQKLILIRGTITTIIIAIVTIITIITITTIAIAISIEIIIATEETPVLTATGIAIIATIAAAIMVAAAVAAITKKGANNSFLRYKMKQRRKTERRLPHFMREISISDFSSLR
jgi:hypothetical protein